MQRPALNAENKALFVGRPVQDTGDSVSTATQGSALAVRGYTGIASIVLAAPKITDADTAASPKVIVRIVTADTDATDTAGTVLKAFDTIDTGDTAGTYAGYELDMQKCKGYIWGRATVSSGSVTTVAPIVLTGLFKKKGW